MPRNSTGPRQDKHIGENRLAWRKNAYGRLEVPSSTGNCEKHPYKPMTVKLYIGCINGVPSINRKTFYQYITVDKPPAIGQTVDIVDAHNTLGKMIRVKILDIQGHPTNLKVLGEHMGVLRDIGDFVDKPYKKFPDGQATHGQATLDMYMMEGSIKEEV